MRVELRKQDGQRVIGENEDGTMDEMSETSSNRKESFPSWQIEDRIRLVYKPSLQSSNHRGAINWYYLGNKVFLYEVLGLADNQPN